MSNVLIDNWGLAACSYRMNIDTKCNSLSDYEDINLCWQNFLTGIVVWDTVVYNIGTLSELSYSMYENARKISPLNEYLKNENVFKVSCNRIDRGLRNLSFFEIAKKQINQVESIVLKNINL